MNHASFAGLEWPGYIRLHQAEQARSGRLTCGQRSGAFGDKCRAGCPTFPWQCCIVLSCGLDDGLNETGVGSHGLAPAVYGRFALP